MDAINEMNYGVHMNNGVSAFESILIAFVSKPRTPQQISWMEQQVSLIENNAKCMDILKNVQKKEMENEVVKTFS